MKILFLGYSSEQTGLIDFLKSQKCRVTHASDKITPDFASEFDLIISFGYKHIIRQEILSVVRRPILNLHISLLPFNRGAHPNFWAFVENTPHGVTIHQIDAGVDTGDIVFQREVKFSDSSSTFLNTYLELQKDIESLFIQNWQAIRDYSYQSKPQVGEGTCHKVRDLPTFTGGWGAKIVDVLAELKRKRT